MKRVKAACILQTLVFSQRPELGFSRDAALVLNREEAEKYKKALDLGKVRYMVTSEDVLDNGSLVIKIKKQYNDKADVAEYFENA